MISYNGSVLKVNNGWVDGEFPTPPTTNLPPMTLKVQYTNTSVPGAHEPRTTDYYTYRRVSTTDYIYLITLTAQPPEAWLADEFAYSNWGNRFGKILDANVSGVTSMYRWFLGNDCYCPEVTLRNAVDVTSLKEFAAPENDDAVITSIYIDNLVNLEDADSMCQIAYNASSPTLQSCTLKNTTSKLTNCHMMFYGCRNLTNVPLFNTKGVTDVRQMFDQCTKMNPSQVLAWYQQLSTQPNPPANHIACFRDAGKNVSGGSEVLAQIPASWGGTGEG